MMTMLFLPEEGGVRVQGLGQVHMLKRTHTHTSTGIRSSGDEIIHQIFQISIFFYNVHGILATNKSDGQIKVTSSGSKGGHFWCDWRHVWWRWQCNLVFCILAKHRAAFQNCILAHQIKLKHKVSTMLFALKTFCIYVWQVFYKKSNDTQRAASRIYSDWVSRCKQIPFAPQFGLPSIFDQWDKKAVCCGCKYQRLWSKGCVAWDDIEFRELVSFNYIAFPSLFSKVQLTTLILEQGPCLVSVRKLLPLGNARTLWTLRAKCSCPFHLATAE